MTLFTKKSEEISTFQPYPVLNPGPLFFPTDPTANWTTQPISLVLARTSLHYPPIQPISYTLPDSTKKYFPKIPVFQAPFCSSKHHFISSSNLSYIFLLPSTPFIDSTLLKSKRNLFDLFTTLQQKIAFFLPKTTKNITFS